MKEGQRGLRNHRFSTALFGETQLYYARSPAVEFSRQRSLFKLRIWVAIMSILTLTVSFWENEEYHSIKDPGNPLIVALRGLLVCFVVLQLCLLIKQDKVTNWESDPNTRSYRAYGKVYLAALLTCPTQIPLFDKSFHTRQLGKTMTLYLDDILVLIISLRLILVIPALIDIGLLSNSRARFFLEMHKIPNSMLFKLKGLFNQYALVCILTINLMNLTIGGFLIHMVERSLEESDGEMSQVTNGFWLVEISERTIGYGDLVPQTHIGRVLVIIYVIVGICNLSTAVGLVFSYIQLSSRELKLASRLNNTQHLNKGLRTRAVTLIQTYWKLQLKRKSGDFRLKEAQKFSIHLRKFKFERTLWNAKNSTSLRDNVASMITATRPLWRHFTTLTEAVKPCLSTSHSLLTRIAKDFKTVSLIQGRIEGLEREGRGMSEEGSSTLRSITSPSRIATRANLRRSSMLAYRNFQRRLFHSSSLTSDPPSPISANL